MVESASYVFQIAQQEAAHHRIEHHKLTSWLNMFGIRVAWPQDATRGLNEEYIPWNQQPPPHPLKMSQAPQKEIYTDHLPSIRWLLVFKDLYVMSSWCWRMVFSLRGKAFKWNINSKPKNAAAHRQGYRVTQPFLIWRVVTQPCLCAAKKMLPTLVRQWYSYPSRREHLWNDLDHNYKPTFVV